MSNTNRDYAIVYDVKNSSLVLSRPLVFYITDKNTSNIFVRLVTIVDVGNGIDQYTDLEPASNYALTMRVIKPNNEVKSIEATQHEPESIFQFDLTEDFKDIPGKYICELTISTIVNSRQELITSDPFSYEVKRSILSNVGEIIETEDTTVEKILNDLDAAKAELSSQIKANNNDLNIERKRIDSLARLSEGSTTGDAELIDARIGADGITYDNLGSGIRTQLSNIKTGIETLSSVANIITIDKLSDDLAEGLGNYIDKYNLVLNTNAYRGACHIQNGKLTSYTSASDNNIWAILDVTPGQRVKISLRSHNTTNYHIILADKDNNIIANYINDEDQIYTDYEITIPKDAVKLGVNSYSYLPTILSYEFYSPLVNRDYVDAQKITLDKLSDELAEGLGDYNEITNLEFNKGACHIKDGKLASYTSENDNNRFTIVSVTPGQKLKISLRSHNTTNYHIILADRNDNIIANYINDADKVYTDYELIIPRGVTKLGVNSYSYNATIKIYEIISPIASRDYVDSQKITIDKLSDDLANGLGGYSEITNLEFNRGACHIQNGKLTSYTSENDNNRFAIVDVTPGQRLKISLRSHNTTNYHIILADKDNNIVANYINDKDQVYTDYELIIPKNVVKLGVNSYSYNATIKRYGITSPIATQQFVLDAVNNPSESGLEDYYNNDNYLDNKIAEIKNNTKVISGVSFAFITDLHMKSNRLQSKYLLKKVLDNTSVPFVVNGGDIVRAYGNKADIQEDVDKWYKYVKYLDGKMFNVHGNHDFTISSNDGTTGYTYDKWYNYDYIMREQETNVVCENGKLYYYFDNPVQKVRFIVLDGIEYINAGDNPWGAGIGMSQEQYDWFIDALSNVDNYNFVVFSHQAANSNLKGASGLGPIQGILEALNNKTSYSYNDERLNISVDFSGNASICCCHICGHGHADGSATTNNVLSIETTCDAHYWDDGYNAAQGTITEQAFDVFSIDTYNRTIKAVRIGRGNNREWTY